jgi:hypothetical protein
MVNITDNLSDYDSRFDGECLGSTYEEEYGNEVDIYGN